MNVATGISRVINGSVRAAGLSSIRSKDLKVGLAGSLGVHRGSGAEPDVQSGL
jgi:hypothetical protein